MKPFYLSYLAGAAIGAALLAFFVSLPASFSFILGSALMMLNVAALHFAWSRILAKKQVALSVGVIVIKYAILGFIIYRVSTGNYLPVAWFAAGFALVLISAVVSVPFQKR